MCDPSPNNFFEPGHVDLCDKVIEQVSKISLDIEQGMRDEMSDDAITALAQSIVHPQPEHEPTRYDYEE